MTENEKDQIITYRKQGYGYSQISNLIGISKNSIKSFCKRHGLGGTVAYEAVNDFMSCHQTAHTNCHQIA